MSAKRKKKVSEGKCILIGIRYILPIAFAIASLAVMFIPCLQYSTTEGTNDVMSSAELFSQAWEYVREYLFSGGDTEGATEMFAWAMLIWLISTALLYVVGLISSVIVAICALRYVSYPDDKDQIRLYFVTAIPNRIVVCVLYALTLPLLFLSRISIPFFDMMDVDVLLNVTFLEPWGFGLIFLAITIILSVISAYFEKQLGRNVFKKRIIEKLGRQRSSEDALDDFDDGKNEDGSEYTSMFSTENKMNDD